MTTGQITFQPSPFDDQFHVDLLDSVAARVLPRIGQAYDEYAQRYGPMKRIDYGGLMFNSLPPKTVTFIRKQQRNMIPHAEEKWVRRYSGLMVFGCHFGILELVHAHGERMFAVKDEHGEFMGFFNAQPDGNFKVIVKEA